MNLVIFDLDGTLTKSSKADVACFEAVLKKTLGLAEVRIDLAQYEHATASFIFRYLFHQRHKRNPRPEEIEEAQRLHVAYLKQVTTVKPTCVREIPGAARALAMLQADPQWQVAVASGCWRSSGLRKLAHSGLDVREVPMAFAEDGLSREGIVGRARERAFATAKVVSFDRIVMVGDGLWDLRTARNLGYGFIGITADCDPAAMRRHGARVLLPDFSDIGAFMRSLDADEITVSRATV